MTCKIPSRLLLIAFGLLAFWPRPAAGQIAPSEYEVKAAFLYHFLKYVEWPAQAFSGPGDPLVVAVFGEDPFGPLLAKAIDGKILNGRTLVIRRLNQIDRVKDCHLLFIARSERGRLNQLLSELKTTSLLTVSEMERFAERGGMINFKMQADKVRFEINVKAAERAGLKISSKLLNVATIVADDPR